MSVKYGEVRAKNMYIHFILHILFDRDIRQELYGSTEFYISGSGAQYGDILDLIKRTTRNEVRGPVYLISSKTIYILCIYEHRLDEVDSGHLSIPFHIPNESINRRQRYWFLYRSRCTDDEGVILMTYMFIVGDRMILNR